MLFSRDAFAARTHARSSNRKKADTAQRNDGARPSATADTGAIRLGGGFRPVAQTRDAGKVRLGGGFRRTAQG